jgi:hypothetical protein
VPAAVRPVDDALGGGLPAGRLTELVSAVPSGGGQTVLASLIAATQAARQRIALVDGSDAFAPGPCPATCCATWSGSAAARPEQAFAAADILVRDGNYAVVVLDLRGCAERALRRTPASVWYRLQRAAEGGSVAVLVQTQSPSCPRSRGALSSTGMSLADADCGARDDVAGRIGVRAERSHAQDIEELAG